MNQISPYLQPATYRFSKCDRLLSAKQFQAVFDAPIKKIHTPHLLLFISHSSQPRLGLAITKKKLKNATERNRLKRLTRESFRLARPEIAAVDMILIVKKSYPKTHDISSEVADIFSKIKKFYPGGFEFIE